MISTVLGSKALRNGCRLTRLMRCRRSLTNEISPAFVISWYRRDQLHLSLATCTASCRTSTGYPPSRRCGARSITVGVNPERLSQYARVGPAILAPEMRMVVFLLIIMVLSFEITTRADTLNEA